MHPVAGPRVARASNSSLHITEKLVVPVMNLLGLMPGVTDSQILVDVFGDWREVNSQVSAFGWLSRSPAPLTPRWEVRSLTSESGVVTMAGKNQGRVRKTTEQSVVHVIDKLIKVITATGLADAAGEK